MEVCMRERKGCEEGASERRGGECEERRECIEKGECDKSGK
jgi:hypothetical protein